LPHLLQDLNFNFQTVILPEALTAFQAEEPSVVGIVKDLDGLVSWVGSPLDNITETLEQLVVNATSLGGTAFTLSVSEYYFSIAAVRFKQFYCIMSCILICILSIGILYKLIY